jgi:adenine phosphoribosyltransferase
MNLKKVIRTIPDYPKKGILFYDITTLLKNKTAFKTVINALWKKYRAKKIDKVVAVDARGFIFGAPLAHKLGVGFIPVRKKGKLPAETLGALYTLEYGQDELTMHKDAIEPGEKILLIDDLLATGGTISAVTEIVKKLGGKIVGIGFVIELTFLKGIEKLKGYPVFSLIKYAK